MDIKLQKTGLDIEIKARCENQEKIRKILKLKKAKFLGKFNMEDVYFNVKSGRLKTRVGDIDDILIQYNRENKSSPKRSDFLVSIIDKKSNVIPSLKKALGVKVIVKKQREIYILDNIRFHIDNVVGLGKFIEIEVRGEKESQLKKLREQIKEYLQFFDIKKKDLIAGSYSDLLLKK
ncbi:MAG TPA: CYTH domain-containing protein [Patescibacteria group bacterium]|nr:CYTH domain-containing protein [Patescibacteria group bacterium]